MVGDNIRKVRMKRGLTQAQLADRVNVSEKTVSSWEVNRTEPSMSYIERIADVLTCQKSELLGDSVVSADDMLFLKKFHSLDDYGKRNVSMILNNEFERCALEKSESSTA